MIPQVLLLCGTNGPGLGRRPSKDGRRTRHSPHGSPFIAKDFRIGRPACQQFASRTALQGHGIARKIGVSSTVMAWIRSRKRKDGTTIQQVNWRDKVSNKQYAETFADQIAAKAFLRDVEPPAKHGRRTGCRAWATPSLTRIPPGTRCVPLASKQLK